MARQDGCTHAAAAQLLQQVDRAKAEPAHTGRDATAQLSCRRILLQLTMLKVHSVCCACKLHACAKQLLDQLSDARMCWLVTQKSAFVSRGMSPRLQ